MMELWLKFQDENGSPQRILVKGDNFTIGRSPENTLPLKIDKLSRNHLKIERFGDLYVVSDAGSSNGTTINQTKLQKPTTLRSGDRLDLGGGLDIEVELLSDEDYGAVSYNFAEADELENESSFAAEQAASQPAAARNAKPVAETARISKSLFIIAPILGILVLVTLGGLLYALGGKSDSEIAKSNKDDFIYTSNSDDFDDDEPKNKKTKDPDERETPTPSPLGTPGNSPNNSTVIATPEVPETTPTPKISSDNDKIERSSAAFMRQIALNDPKAFLTTKQISILSGKVNQFKGSSALADNFRSARKSQSQIQSMAASKNLKPEFLAVAAVAKLGNQRGDVASTAQSMLETLDNLSTTFGNELAYDNLLVIAGYDQGVAGQTQAMRDMIARTTTQFPTETTQTIRTIWFLKEKGKISDAQFEFALRFLAIGTIAQNPKDFNVNSEAVVFN